MKRLFFILSLLFLLSCRSNEKTMSLLKSNDKEDIIKGSLRAGKSHKQIFVPSLLKDADDPRRSTNIRSKGVSVYQAKMIALSKIFRKEPPVKIIQKPDSIVIKFFIELSKKDTNNLQQKDKN